MTDRINALVVGKGGRETTLAEMLKASGRIEKVYVAPGNGGTYHFADNLPSVKPDYPYCDSFIDVLRSYDIGLVVTGSETDLVGGLSDQLRMAGIPVFGVSQPAAMFEGSKIFARRFMRANVIPAPKHKIFADDSFDSNKQDAFVYGYALFGQNATNSAFGLVVKADGLAGGKGAIVCSTFGEYKAALDKMAEFGEAGRRFLVENKELGVEVSATVVIGRRCMGVTPYIVLPFSQDYKPVGVGDTGPNTGGMGSIIVRPTKAVRDYIDYAIIHPTIEGAHSMNRPMDSGVLYLGLMLTNDGRVVVLEYNMRFGDPEAQVVLRSVKSDVGEMLYQAAAGDLSEYKLKCSRKDMVNFVLASQGYPGDYSAVQDKPISWENMLKPGVWVNVAGAQYSNGVYTTAGSRVLNIGGENIDDVRSAARTVAENNPVISTWRHDIGCNAEKVSKFRLRL